MFVFKAAVVGAGTMGGEIAQVIASAGIPVVLKDVKQEFVDLGLRKAEEVTKAQLGQPRPQAEDQRGAGGRADDRDPRPHHGDDGLRGLRRRRLRHRGRAGAHADQANGARRARRLHARPRDPRVEHVGARDQRDGARDEPPRQGRRLSLLLSRVDDAPRRDRRGRGHVRRDDAGRDDVRPGHPQDADRLRRGARLRRQQDPQLRDLRGLADAGGGRAVDQGDRRCRRRRAHRADGAVLPHGPARPRHGPARRRAPARLLRRQLLRPRGHGRSGAGGGARREGRQGLLRERRAALGRSDGVRRRRARPALRAQGVRRGVPRARGRHGDRARHRPRHDGRRRTHPAAVRARRPDGPRRRPRAARDRDRRLGRALRAAADPPPARRAGAARREGRPGLLRLRAARRRRLRAGRGRQARDAGRRRGGVDGPAAGELAVAAGHRGAHPAVGPRRRRSRSCARS